MLGCNPPVQERHLLLGVEPVLATGHHLERGAGPAGEIVDRRQRSEIVILPVEDMRRHSPVDRVLPHVAQMLLVQRQRRNTTEYHSVIYYFADVGKIGQKITGGRKSVV